MKKNSIVYKLFGITLLFFTILLGLSFLVQSFFLEDYYTKKKMGKIKNDIETFSMDYLNESWSLNQTIQNLDCFIKENNSPMIIVDENGKIKHSSKQGETLVIRTKMRQFYTADLRKLIENTSFIPKIGDKIKVNGTVLKEEKKFRDILKVDFDGQTYYDKGLIEAVYYDINNNRFPENLNLEEIRGEVVYINDDNQNENMSYKNNILVGEIEHVFSTNKFSINQNNSDDILSYEFLDSSLESNNMIFIKPLKSKDTEKKSFVFVLTSIQPINETIDIINEFVGYVFLVALLLVICLSFIYSKMIANPLLKMNQVAEKMANLDFSDKCQINSNDELGNLSKSINTISKNLSNSLDSLKESNEKLVDDIESERRQEEKRRQFIADISHELKTPLGVMKGFAEGIKDGIYESKKDYYLDVIIDEIEKMDIMVLDMLTISKLQSVGYKLEIGRFYIDDLIESTLEKYTYIIDEKGLKVNYSCDKQFEVNGDETEINRVIDNFISNAAKYSKSGAKINIKIQECSELIYIYIENTGVYIREEEINKIWNRFYRVESSRNKLLGGTGLGLSIVKNILELHNSDYGVRNTKDGVEFYFSLIRAKKF